MAKYLRVSVTVAAVPGSDGKQQQYIYSPDYLAAVRAGKVEAVAYSPEKGGAATALAVLADGVGVPACAEQISAEDARTLCGDIHAQHGIDADKVEELLTGYDERAIKWL